MSAAMEQAGGLSVRDKLYLLTNALLDEKSGGAKPGKDNIELVEVDFVKGCTWPVGAVCPALDGVGGCSDPA